MPLPNRKHASTFGAEDPPDDRITFSYTARQLYAMSEEERLRKLDSDLLLKARMAFFESERRVVENLDSKARDAYFSARDEKGMPFCEYKEGDALALEIDIFMAMEIEKNQRISPEQRIVHALKRIPDLLGSLRGLEKYEEERALTYEAFCEEQSRHEAEIIERYEKRKAIDAQKPGKGISRFAGQVVARTYHVLPDGQTIKVKGDASSYKITSKAALETLDRLLAALCGEPGGWMDWSKKYRARFSAPSAKAFAKKYIENLKETAGCGYCYGHNPRARLKK